MYHRKLIDTAWTYNVNIRAEDGPQPPRGWRSLFDTLLVPLCFIAALVLFAMLTTHSAHAQARSGRMSDWDDGKVEDTLSIADCLLRHASRGID